MIKTDILVIGGGIAGLTLAKYLAEERIDFILLEDHKHFGEKSCGENITENIGNYNFFEIYESKKGVERINEFIIIKTKYDEIKCPIPNILVNKKTIEEKLSKQAKNYGAHILMGEKVLEIEKDDDGFIIYPQKIKTRIIVGADGANSLVQQYIGQKIPNYGIAVSGILIKKPSKEDVPIINFSKKDAPYGYVWYFPKKNNWNIGIGTARKEFFNISFSKFKESYPSYIKWKAGIIPVSKPLKSFDKNIILVGDSASQVIAALGDGILPSMVCAKIGAEVLTKFSKNNFKNIDTFLYEKMWKKEIGKIFNDGYLAYKILTKIYFSEYLTHQFLKLMGKMYS